MASSCGVLHLATASDTDLPNPDLGQGPDAVLGFLDKGNIDSGLVVIFDNLFTSFPLLDKLTEKGIGGLGTIRQNRLQNAPLKEEELVKRERGSYDF